MNALESNWAVLLEEIGLWIPSEITINEHDDRPEGEEESGMYLFSSSGPFFFPITPFSSLYSIIHL